MDTRSISDDYGISSSCKTDTAPGGYSRNYCSVSASSASAKVKDTKTDVRWLVLLTAVMTEFQDLRMGFLIFYKAMLAKA